jgi:hypothetical protein
MFVQAGQAWDGRDTTPLRAITGRWPTPAPCGNLVQIAARLLALLRSGRYQEGGNRFLDTAAS